MREYLLGLASKKGIRIDGRKFLQYREISVKKGIIKNAEGSALVTIGNTKVIAGVKLNVGEPFPDKPDEGAFIVNFESSPLAYGGWEPGPPGKYAIEIARVVDRGIRSAETIDLKKLCIREGELVWLIYIDIYPINHDGNLFDASMLASIAALNDARFPELEGDKVKFGTKTDQALPIKSIPISCTFCKIGNFIFIDPCLVEEENMDSRLTVTVCDGKIVALQKGGYEPMSEAEVINCVESAIKISKDLKKYV